MKLTLIKLGQSSTTRFRLFLTLALGVAALTAAAAPASFKAATPFWPDTGGDGLTRRVGFRVTLDNPRHLGKSLCGNRGDSIVELDSAVGDLLATLERSKLRDNTLVIFSSDNGGIMDDGYEDVGSFDLPCKGVLRGYKGSLFKDGHRVPLIARWPGQIKAGGECNELVTLLDLPASLAALTGQTLPPGAAIDSCNVLPALLGQPHDQPGRETFVAHVGGVAGKVPLAIHQGQWKLILEGGARPSYGDANRSQRVPLTEEEKKQIQQPFLVNLASDLTESTNLASAYPERVAEMKQTLDAIIA
jgi:arylsulfatase A-like enzyme